jgi:glycosyltransferase involved in cell wall biosynthesis
MLLSVIMPVYNEKNTLIEILNRIEAVPVKKEIIIVDDGSKDGTRQILRDIKGQNVKVILHERNQGKGAAIKTGLTEATGDIVIIQDGDLEYDPMDYLKLIPLIQSGEAQVVYGSRTLGSNERSYHRYYWGGQFVTLVTNILYGLKITDEPTCYKMFKKEVIDRIKLDCTGFEFCPEVTAKVVRLGYTIHEVPISYHPRSFEEGKKIKWRDGLIAIWTLLKCRFLPISKILKS